MLGHQAQVSAVCVLWRVRLVLNSTHRSECDRTFDRRHPKKMSLASAEPAAEQKFAARMTTNGDNLFHVQRPRFMRGRWFFLRAPRA
jgi:hypothetical protein